MRFLAILLILVPLGAGAVTVEELMKEMERRDLEHEREIEENKRNIDRLTGVIDQLRVRLNDTEELEARVTILEDSVADLEVDVVALTDEVDDVESVNILQDEQLNTLEAEIFDNENDIEALVGDIETLEDSTAGLQLRVTDLEADVVVLDQRVDELEAGGGGNNNTDLTERVETLEEVTLVLSTNVSDLAVENTQQDDRISGIEEDVTSLDQRVEDLESGGGGGGNITDLTDRVEALEEVTSQMSGDISELQATSEDFEARIVELEAVIIEPWTACESSPCETNGTCVDVNVDTFICMCRDGFFGVTCAASYQDATFLAALESDVAGSGPNPIVFTWEVINYGSHYSPETGKYTVPYDGIYQFSANLQDDGTDAYIDFIIDDSITAHDDVNYASSRYRSVTLIQELTAGQTVHVTTPSGMNVQGTTVAMQSYFGGHLISAN